MHILFIPSWYPAKAGEMSGCFFREQALALSNYGLQVGVITPAFRSLFETRANVVGKYGFQFEDDLGLNTVRYHGIRAFSWNHMLNIKFWEHTGLRAFDKYQQRYGRPDVLHVHSMIFGLAWAAAINRVHGIPFVVTEHSSEFLRNTIRPKLLAYLQKTVVNASRIFAVSSKFSTILNAKLELPKGRRWEVMHNMVSSKFYALNTVPNTNAEIKSPPILLSIGALEANKAHANLLHATRMVLDAGFNFKLRIGGSGPEEHALKELAATLRLEDKVIFLGHCSREQVAQEMAFSDAFVLPSKHETFGVVVVEALLSGRPVVSTRCGGPEDIITEGLDGYLVENDDPVALSIGMINVLRKRMTFDARELRDRCIERFSESAYSKRHAEIYREVISSKTDMVGVS